MLNAADFARIENETYNTNRFPDPDSFATGTNWQDVLFRDAAIQNHQLNFSGGNDKTQMLLSLNYFDQEGVVKKSKFDRYAIRFNLDHTVKKWLKIGTTTTFTRSINNRIQTGSVNNDGGGLTQSLIGAALSAPPVLKPLQRRWQCVCLEGPALRFLLFRIEKPSAWPAGHRRYPHQYYIKQLLPRFHFC